MDKIYTKVCYLQKILFENCNPCNGETLLPYFKRLGKLSMIELSYLWRIRLWNKSRYDKKNLTLQKCNLIFNL